MFRVGDKVRCLKPRKSVDGTHTLLKNRAYRVAVPDGSLGTWIKVEGDCWDWFANRFEKVRPNGRMK